MEMIPVRSSAISAIGYDSSTQQMVIRFKGSGNYTFYNVPPHIFSEFMAASSKGSYYHRYIEGRYRG